MALKLSKTERWCSARRSACIDLRRLRPHEGKETPQLFNIRARCSFIQGHTEAAFRNQPKIGPSRAGTCRDQVGGPGGVTVSYTHLRAHETRHDLVCRLLLEKKKQKTEEAQKTTKVQKKKKAQKTKDTKT